MNEALNEKPKRRIRLRDFIHLLPVWFLLMVGSDICVQESDIARMLKFPWARLLAAIVWLSVLTYFGLGFWLRRRMGAKAWVVSFFSAAILFALPPLVLTLNTRSIPVTHFLQPAEMTALKASFPHPYFHYTRTGSGATLVVRNSDCSEALLNYLQTNHLSVAK